MKLLITSLLVLLSITSSAQKKETGENKTQFTGLSVRVGTFLSRPDVGQPITSFRKLAPNSSLAFRDVIDFEQNKFNITGVDAPIIDIGTHFTKPSETGETKKWNPEFSIGISYNPIELLASSYQNYEILRIDTLQSTQTGQDVYVDSIVNQSFNYSYQQELIYLNVGASISTNPMKRWRISIGVEASVGYSLIARTFLDKAQFDRLESSDGSFVRGLTVGGPDFEHEQIDNERGISTRLALPVVLSFRLSKELDKQLSNYILVLENRPNFTHYNIQELDSQFLYTNALGIGIRYVI